MKRLERVLALFLSILLIVFSLQLGTITNSIVQNNRGNALADGDEGQGITDSLEEVLENGISDEVLDSLPDDSPIDENITEPVPEQVEKYDYDTIVAEAEAEQAYRESVEYVEDTIVFSVLNYRAQGDKAAYLTDADALCQKYSLHNVTFILETNKTDVEQKANTKSYQMFYTAGVKADDIWTVVDEMTADEDILTAEPDFIWEKSDMNDMTEVSGETLMAEVENCGWSYTDLNCMNIWGGLSSGHAPGEGVVVAVIDTGVDYNHVDLKQNMWVNSGEIPNDGIDNDENGYIDDIHGINLIDPAKQGDPMDDMGHGTHVAGIIGMTAGNGGGVGVAYGSKIMAVKAGQANGTFASTDIAKAIQYAATNGADVINMSFGGTGKSNLVEAALADAFGSCVLVAAAGNNNRTTSDGPFALPKEDFYPAGYNYVLGVMACDGNSLASFSNWDYYKNVNCEYEIIAPGVAIFSTLPGNRYAKWSGTSMSAPMVSAAAAIMRREYKDTNKYSSRFIMGQLAEATEDRVQFVDPLERKHVFNKLNISDSLFNSPKPSISVSDIHFFDSKSISESNNPDGVMQTGETVDLGFVISNHWGIAKDLEVEVNALSSAGIPNPYISFVTDKITLDDEVGTFATVNNGFVYDNDMLVGVDNPIRFIISNDAPNSLLVTLNISIRGKNGMDEEDSNYYSDNRTCTFEIQRGAYLRGVINEDTTLTSDKLWIVDRSVLIPEGVTVNIDPGTKIQFYSKEEGPYAEYHDANILVKGVLNLNGNYDNPIEIYPEKNYYKEKAIDIKLSNPDDTLNAINIEYTKICNPDISITNGNHLYLYGESGAKTYATIRGVLSNSIISGFRGRDTWIQGSMDRVLIHENSSKYSCGDTYYQTMGYYLNNCVFLKGGNIDLFNANYVFSQNAILNNVFKTYWSRVQLYSWHTDGTLRNNYWGTTNEELIEYQIRDQIDDVSLPRADYSNYFTLDDDMSAIYPFVTEAFITDSTGENRLTEVVNNQTVQLHVKFNRDMSQDLAYAPAVSFGSAAPYTDYMVNGDWISEREWVGTTKIVPFINQGTQYIRIKDAAAADDLWLTTGTDEARFSFNITKSSAEALTLQGSGGSNENYLSWVQDDYETLAGYNLYRSTEYDNTIDVSGQNFVKINSTLIPGDTKEYTDTDVEQGVDYYYYFTVVDTQFNESPASNVVKCRPLDEESPIIISRAIETQTEGIAVPVVATVTDNVEVKDVTLYYLPEGETEWKQVKMRVVSDDTYKAVIPAYDVTVGTMRYYIAAEDGTNTSTSGSADLPNVFSVKATVDVAYITLDKTNEELSIGDTITIEATVYPEDATYTDINWSSSDDSVATVDENGTVTAVGIGEALITASSEDGSNSAICNIIVNPVLINELVITPEQKTVRIGDVFTISATITPDDSTNKNLYYQSDNPGAATVSKDGTVNAIGVGEANILVATTDGSDISKICKVIVNPIEVKAVALNAVSKEMEVGETDYLLAMVFPENATNKTVLWTSDHPEVVTVENGRITAVKNGKAIITASSEDGGKKAICSIVVTGEEETEVPIETLELNKSELKLTQGESEDLVASIVPNNATNKELIWRSTDSSIVTVDETGRVQAVGAGKAFVIVRAASDSERMAICSVEVVKKTTPTTLNTPEVTVQWTANGVLVRWDEVDGAENYRVFKKTGSGTWKTVSTQTETEYTDSSLKDGETYTYTVRCMDASGSKYTSNFDKAGKTIQYKKQLDIPEFTVTNTNTGVMVEWTAVEYAENYRVFRKTVGGTWKTLATQAETIYTDTTAKDGTTYIYTVRCMNEDGTKYTSGFNQDGIEITYQKPAPEPTNLDVPEVTIQQTDAGVLIQWNRIEGAAQYRVFRKVNGGSWKVVNTLNATEYTDENVVVGTTYTYTVRCVSSDGSKYTSGFDKEGKKIVISENTPVSVEDNMDNPEIVDEEQRDVIVKEESEE